MHYVWGHITYNRQVMSECEKIPQTHSSREEFGDFCAVCPIQFSSTFFDRWNCSQFQIACNSGITNYIWSNRYSFWFIKYSFYLLEFRLYIIKTTFSTNIYLILITVGRSLLSMNFVFYMKHKVYNLLSIN